MDLYGGKPRYNRYPISAFYMKYPLQCTAAVSAAQTGEPAGGMPAVRSNKQLLAFLLAAGFLLGGPAFTGSVKAIEVILKDGRRLHGDYAPLSGLADVPAPIRPGEDQPLRPIMCLDDGLRRTFFSKRHVREVLDKSSATLEKFKIWQREKSSGRRIYSVGQVIRIEPFDEFGRRTFTMRAAKGPLDVVQGITELTPEWAKVEGITHVWDMRIDPGSIPPSVLEAMLNKQTEPDALEHKKKIARFYLQMKRYEDAARVLESALEQYEGDEQAKADIDDSLSGLRRLSHKRLINELELRRDAGQHKIVFATLKAFPAEGTAGEILQEVGELIGKYEKQMSQRDSVVTALDSLAEQIDGEETKKQLAPILAEIGEELNLTTLGRMTAFRLAKDDKEMLPGEKLALAVSGWLLGSNAAVPKLSTAVSAYKTREAVRKYLNDGETLGREKLYNSLQSREAASPKLVDLLLKNMKPPGELPPPIADKPGYYELETDGLEKSQKVRYLVQLPPEYDPYRHYPTIVTLGGPTSTPEMQLDWWAGPWLKNKKGNRKGQATRRGYIVVAPEWCHAYDKTYLYSAREHAAVLNSLRDACRRFSIDTDRVFLTGHSTGGNAAWDIGLAHPDIWAGVVPITARSDRYCPLYWENARNLPMYFVGGEKDSRWAIDNARDLDRYLLRAFDTTVVEYQGRGREHFQEEVQRIFDWMKLQKRDFFPKKFEAVSMRPWDNFFWWVELKGMPSGAMLAPENWPPPRGMIPMKTEAKLTATNGIYVRTGAERATLWISPEILDLDRRIKITVNGKRINSRQPYIRPDLRVILEDARTRADRQHPFWAKVECETGR